MQIKSLITGAMLIMTLGVSAHASNNRANYAITTGDGGIDYFFGKYNGFNAKDSDFLGFMSNCFLTSWARSDKDLMGELLASKRPFDVLDHIDYSASFTTTVNDEEVNCRDAYPQIKANYWAEFRTHKAMSSFVKKYILEK